MIQKLCIFSVLCLMPVGLVAMPTAQKKTATAQAKEATLKLRQGALFQVMERIDKDEELQNMSEDGAADMLIKESGVLQRRGLYNFAARAKFFTGSFLCGAMAMFACMTYWKQ